MKPGKLFQIYKSTVLYHIDKEERESVVLPAGSIFMIVSTSLNPDLEEVARFFDLHTPWMVLENEKVGLVDILNLTLKDTTPF